MSESTSGMSPRVPKKRTASPIPRVLPGIRAACAGPVAHDQELRGRHGDVDQGRDVEEHLVVFFGPECRHDAGHRRVGHQAELLRSRLLGQRGWKRSASTPLGITRIFSAGQPSLRGQIAAVRFGHGNERVGAAAPAAGWATRRGRAGRSSARPSKSPARRQAEPASRPQNILSPHPTVTTASIRRPRNSRASRQSTGTSYLWASRPVNAGISAASDSPTASKYFRQQVPAETAGGPGGGPVPPAAAPRRRPAGSWR